MNKNVLLATLCLGLSFAAAPTFANNKVQSTYDANRYMQVCKGKKQGAAVSFAYRGIIWNGTCQPQFFPSSHNATIKGDEPELTSICKNNPGQNVINIEGKEIRGKCTLGFAPPAPK